MCLTEITKKYDVPSMDKVIGYKVVDFNPESNKYKSVIFPLTSYEKGVNVDPLSGDLESPNGKYSKGFHIFKQLDNACKWCLGAEEIWEVECTDIVAEGVQDSVYFEPKNANVVVCRKFTYLRDAYIEEQD